MNDNTINDILGSNIEDLDDKFKKEQEQPITIKESKTPIYSFAPTKEEEDAEAEGSLQYSSGQVRVSDSQNLIEDNSLLSNESLYESTLGITKYDELRNKLGLKDGESYTDYFNSTHYVPKGFELDSKLLLAEEKRKRLYQDVQDGKLSKTQFLYESYGKDILKSEGHNLSSSLYWYNRRKNGDYDSILDNPTYMENIIYKANEYFNAEEWFNKSNTLTLNNSLAAYVTGEELSTDTVKSLMPDVFEELNKYYKSDEKIIDLYRAGMLQGFNPVIDVNNDGKADYYYHTNGKLYAVEGNGSVGEGLKTAKAYYNKDGSLNRITLGDNDAVEITQAFLKGFTGFFTDILGFAGGVVGGIVDVYQWATSGFEGSLSLDNATDITMKWNKFINNDSFFFGNNNYRVDSGFMTSDNQVNWNNIFCGVSGVVGTLAAFAATGGLGKLANSSVLSSTSLKGLQGGAKAKAVAGNIIKKPIKTSISLAQKLTGLSNGVPLTTASANWATASSVGLLAVKDFIQTGVQLSANKEALQLSDSDIIGKAFQVSSINAGISMLFRSTMDKGALTRWEEHSNARVIRNNKLKDYMKNGSVNSGFAKLLESFRTNHLRAYNMVNGGLDFIENFTTNYFQSSMANTGKLMDVETFKSSITNPQFVAMQAFSAISSVKGSFGKTSEGLETGSILDSVGSIKNVYDEVTKKIIVRLNETTDADEAVALKSVLNNLDDTANNTKNPKTGKNDKLLGLTTAIYELHESFKENEDSFVTDVLKGTIAANIKRTTLLEMRYTVDIYNNMVDTYTSTAKSALSKGLNTLLHSKRDNIIKASKDVIDGICKNAGISNSLGTSTFLYSMYKNNFTPEVTTKILEKLNVQSLKGKLGFDKDGKLEIISPINDMDDNAKAYLSGLLERKELTPEMLINGYVIYNPGAGSSVEGDKDYKDACLMFKIFSEVVNDYDNDDVPTAKLILSPHESGKNDMLVIPDLGLGEGMTINTIDMLTKAVQALYAMRYTKTADDRFKFLQDFSKILLEDNKANASDLSVYSEAAILRKLLENKFLEVKDCASLYTKLSDEGKKILEDTILPEYVKGVEALEDIQSKSNKTLTKADLTSVAKSLETIRNLNKDVYKQLQKDGFFTDKDLEAVAKVIENPKTGQDFLDLLKEEISSYSLNDFLKDNPYKTEKDYTELINKRRKLASKLLSVILNSPKTTAKKQDVVSNFYSFVKVDNISKESSAFIDSDLFKENIKFFINEGTNEQAIKTLYEKFLLLNSSDGTINVNQNTIDEIRALIYNFKLSTLNEFSDLEPALFTHMIKDYLKHLEKTEHGFKAADFEWSSLDDIILPKLIESNNFGKYYKKYSKRRKLENVLDDAATFTDLKYKDTVEVKTDGHLYIDLSSLKGKYFNKLLDRLEIPKIASDAFLKEPSEIFKIIFQGESMDAVNKNLSNELVAIDNLKQSYPEGTIILDMNNAEDRAEAERIFTMLHYSFAEALPTNRESSIDGINLKQKYEKALSFNISVHSKASLINYLETKLGYSSEDIEVSFTKGDLQDIQYQLDSMFGGLSFINDDTIIDPKSIIYTSINPAEPNVKLVKAVHELYDAFGKTGKLASGKLNKVLAIANQEIGYYSTKVQSLREYILILRAVDELSKFNDNPSGYAIPIIELTDDEYNDFKSKGLWNLEKKDIETVNGKKAYALLPKRTEDGSRRLTSSEWKAKAIELLKEDKVNLNYVIPCYGSSIATTRNILTGSLDTPQNTLGYTPLTSFISKMINTANIDEILKLFSTTEYNTKYKSITDEDKKEVLDFLHNKKVSEVLDESNLDKFKDNPYFLMMYNSILSSKNLTSTILSGINVDGISSKTNLLMLLGNPLYRNILADILCNNRDLIDEDILKLVKNNKLLLSSSNIKSANIDKDYIEYRDFSNPDETSFSGSQAALLNFNNGDIKALLDTLTVDDITKLKSLLEFSKTNNGFIKDDKANPYIKLYQIIKSSSAENSESVLNIFVNDLYKFTKDELDNDIIPLLKLYLSKDDIDKLIDKFEIIHDFSDSYNNKSKPRPEGQRLIQLGENDATFSLFKNAFTKQGSKDNDSYRIALQYALDSLIFRRKKSTYKISEIDALSQNSKSNLIRNLAALLNIEVVPGINRKASLLIENLDINDKLAQLLDSISMLSLSLDSKFKELGLFQGHDIESTQFSDTSFNIALAMYLYSTGVDYQSEWTKYLFINAKTGEIIDTAQQMYGVKSLNDLLYKSTKLFSETSDDIIMFDMSKNMMLSDSISGGKLTYTLLDDTKKNQLRALFIKNGVSQFNEGSYHRYADDEIKTDLQKALYVYSHTPSQKEYEESIISLLEASGVDRRTANLTVRYDSHDLQSSKDEFNAQQQVFYNTYINVNNPQGIDRIRFNSQQKRLNDVLKYNISYSTLPQEVVDEINLAYSNFKDSIPNKKLITYSEKVITAYLSGNKEEYERLLSAFNFAYDKEYNETLSGYPEYTKEQILFTTYLLKSKEASAISFLLTGDFDYIKKLYASEPDWMVDVKGTKIKADELLSKGCYAIDIESFYKGNETYPFQVSIKYFNADGTINNEKSKTIFIPVYYDMDTPNGKVKTKITNIDDARNIFGEFFESYGNKEGMQNSLKQYFNSINSSPDIDFKEAIESTITEDIPVLGYNSSNYDIKHLNVELGIDTSKWNTVDVYTDIFQKLPIDFEVSKETLEGVIDSLGLKQQIDSLCNGSGYHDADYDVISTYILAKYLLGNIINTNEFRTDLIKDLGTIFESLNKTDAYDTDIRDNLNESLYESIRGLEFSKHYTANLINPEYDLFSKVKTVRKLNALFDSQEHDINMKKYYSDYELAFRKSQKEFIDYYMDNKNKSNLSYLVSYIMTKSKITFEEAIDRLSEAVLNSYGKGTNLTSTRLSEMLLDSEDDFARKVLAKMNIIYIDDEYNEFKKSSTQIPSYIIKDYVDGVYPQLSNDVFRYQLENKLNTFNKKVNDDFLECSMFANDAELKEHFKSELNKFYMTRDSNDTQDKIVAKRITIRDSLTESQLEYLKTQPIKSIKKERVYRLVHGLNDKDTIYNTKNINTGNTIIVNRQTFSSLFGIDYEDSLSYYTDSSGNKVIYLPVIRQPLDKVDSFQCFKVVVTNDNKVNCAMSPDVLLSLMGGDLDGDHILILKPTKAIQNFCNSILPITKASWNIWDGLQKTLDVEMPNTKLTPRIQKQAMAVLSSVVAKDLSDLCNGANYAKLREQRAKELKKFYLSRTKKHNMKSVNNIDLSDDDINTLMDIAWIKQGPMVSDKLAKSGYIYYSYSEALGNDKLNRQNILNLRNFKSLNRKLSLSVDVSTGQFQKAKIAIENPNHNIDSVFNYASFNLSNNSILLVDKALSDASSKKQFISKLDNLIEQRTKNLNSKESVKSLHNIINDINDSQDFIIAMCFFEQIIREDSKSQQIINNALIKLNEESLNDKLYDNYDTVANDYIKNNVDVDRDFFNRATDSVDKIDAITNGGDYADYYGNYNSASSDAQLLIANELSKHKQESNLEAVNLKDFKNKQRAKIILVNKDIEGISPDSFKLCKGSSKYRYGNFISIQLDFDDTIKVKQNSVISTGMKISENSDAKSIYDGYTVAFVDNATNKIILYKSKAIDNSTKIGIPGSSTLKGVFQGKSDSSLYNKEMQRDMEDALAITNMSELNFKKMSAELKSNNYTITHKKDYDILECDIGILEDTAYWKQDSKATVLDSVGIGNNLTSLEGMIMVGGYVLDYKTNPDGTVKVEYNNSKVAKLEQKLKNFNMPKRVSQNGIYIYKCMLLSTLLKYFDFKNIPNDNKINYLKSKILSRSFFGINGTNDIISLMDSLDVKAFEGKLDIMTSTERALFDSELLRYLFPTEVTKALENDEQQLSKKSHASVLTALHGLAESTKHQNGFTASQSRIDLDGNEIQSETDGFITTLDFRNKLEDASKKYDKEDKYHTYLSSRDVEEMTDQAIVPKGYGYVGSTADNFLPLDYRGCKILKGETNISTDTKAGELSGTVFDDSYSRTRVILPSQDSKEYFEPSKFNSNLENTNSDKYHSDKTLNWKKVNKDSIKQMLYAALIPNQDKMSLGYYAFKPSSSRYMSMTMHKRHLTPENGNFNIKAVPVSNKNTSVFNRYKLVSNSFSSPEYFRSGEESYNRMLPNYDSSIYSKSDVISGQEDSYEFNKNIEETLNKPRKDLDISKLFINTSNSESSIKHIQEDSYMTKEYCEGNAEAMDRTYEKSCMESGGIKIDSDKALEAERITKTLKTEGTAKELQIDTRIINLHNLTESMGVTSYFNEYVFILGTLDRLSAIDSNTDLSRESKNALKSEILSTLPYSLEEANIKVKKFETICPYIVEEYKQLMSIVVKEAVKYSKLCCEPGENPFFLLTPLVRQTIKGKEKTSTGKYIKTMLLNTQSYIQDSDGKGYSYQNYAGYNFFKSFPETVKQISNQSAIYHGSVRLKKGGYMSNVKILDEVTTFLKELRELVTKDINSKDKELLDIYKNLNMNLKDLKDYEAPDSSLTLANQFLDMYDKLNDIINSIGLSYAEARRANDEDAIKAFEYSNDIIAILCTKTKEGRNLLESLGRKLYTNSEYALVDTYGRAYSEDIGNYRKLSDASLEYVPNLVRYYLGGDINRRGFFLELAMDCINGDAYYMPKTLSDIMMKEVFVSKIPSKAIKVLKNINGLAIKLIMSSPFKLVDRLLKFTGFDAATLSLANPKTLLKSVKARNELSAYYSSKGTVCTDELKEFLYSQGLDPNDFSVNKLTNDTDYKAKGHLFNSYFDSVNKMFTYQTLFQRYAFWLACKDDLLKGKETYGSSYYLKDKIKSLGTIDEYDENGDIVSTKVSKEGNQAAFIMAQNLGSPGDFPSLAKKFNGLAAFTTFPLALLRWGKGEAASLSTAFKNMFVEGERKQAFKYLSYNGGGILGIYLVSYLLTQIITSMFNSDEDEKEEYEESGAIPDIFRSLLQGSPVMDSYSSINPVKELGDLTISPVVEAVKNEEGIGQGLLDWFLKNIVGHINPAAKSVGESLLGYDLIGDNVISTKDEYTAIENLLRKSSGYILGSAGSNQLASELKDNNGLMSGLQKAVEAELGNTKVYKSNQKNYYKAFTLVNNFKYADDILNKTTSFNYDDFKSLKSDIRKALNKKAKLTEIYEIIDSYASKGVDFNEIKSAVNNCSLRYKLESLDNLNKFTSTLSESDLVCIKAALAYEDEMFPWLDTLASDLKKRYNEEDELPDIGKYYTNNYNDYEDYYLNTKYNYNKKNYYNKNYNNYSKYNNFYDPFASYRYFRNAWDYGKSTDLYGNKYNTYVNKGTNTKYKKVSDE